MEFDRVEKVEKDMESMKNDFVDLKLNLQELTASNKRLVEITDEIKEIRKDMTNIIKEVAERQNNVMILQRDVNDIQTKLHNYREIFDKITARVNEVEDSTNKQAYAILKWLLTAVGVILVGYVMSKLGLKV
jgi:chromosome segregation ATPase